MLRTGAVGAVRTHPHAQVEGSRLKAGLDFQALKQPNPSSGGGAVPCVASLGECYAAFKI